MLQACGRNIRSPPAASFLQRPHPRPTPLTSIHKIYTDAGFLTLFLSTHFKLFELRHITSFFHGNFFFFFQATSEIITWILLFLPYVVYCLSDE